MSRASPKAQPALRRAQASVFAALGDETRLLLVTRIIGNQPRSISELTKGSRLSRQAITKHLRVLENVGIVHCERRGRESLYELDPLAIEEAKQYLDLVSEQWDRSLARLKAFVEP
jgi:DNA-binding transcriptional ArsR family regulator